MVGGRGKWHGVRGWGELQSCCGDKRRARTTEEHLRLALHSRDVSRAPCFLRQHPGRASLITRATRLAPRRDASYNQHRVFIKTVPCLPILLPSHHRLQSRVALSPLCYTAGTLLIRSFHSLPAARLNHNTTYQTRYAFRRVSADRSSYAKPRR